MFMVVKRKIIPLDMFYDVVENDDRTVHRSITVFEAQKERKQREWEKQLKNLTFEDMEKRAASKYGRRHLGYPCDEAQDIKLSEGYSLRFYEHLKNCKECKMLFEKLDRSIKKR